MKKENIRKRILSLRNSQSKFSAITKSYRIQEKLFKLPEFIEAKTILFYVSTKNEVITEPMIKKALELGKRVFIPISDKKNKTLIISELKDFDNELEPGAFKILEPKKEFIRRILPEEIDLVIVPGVAFDHKGNRLGYGMGFYDRFLRLVRKKMPIIGLAYEFQVIEKIPVGDADMAIDKVLTENEIIEFKR